MKLWPRPVKSKMRFHDLRHTAATLMLRAGVDPHRVQRVLRHASVTTTTGTYAHLAIEDLRDAVNKIGPQPSEPSPVADSLRASLGSAPAANEDACPKAPENAALNGAPGRSRTCGPRLRRPDEERPPTSNASQPLATTRDEPGADSKDSQVFASFTENSADRLRMLLTVREVAAYLRVSTATVYELCARGKLRHVRVLNAIRVASCDLHALLHG